MSKSFDSVNLYRLRFIDSDENSIYETVQAKNDLAMIYYAKKVMKANSWWLEDWWSLWMSTNFLWITKHIVRYIRRPCDAKTIMTHPCVFNSFKPLEQTQ